MADKRGLILLAHGSRNINANKHIDNLVQQLIPLMQNKYALISYGFLEFSPPSIEEAITWQIERGIETISLFPFFLIPGNHVNQDIPNIVNEMKRRHPNVHMSILPPFGCANAMATWIQSLL